jgi:hypothetical protein
MVRSIFGPLRLSAIAGFGLAAALAASNVYAANPEPVVAQVTFVDAITITEVNALQYGLIDQVLNLETIIIAPDSGVTGTGTGLIVGGTQAAANLTVAATVSQSITILVDTVVSGAGYSLGTFFCNYDGGTDTACDGAGYGETSATSASLLIGATLTGDNTATPGAADGSFNVTVSYQ